MGAGIPGMGIASLFYVAAALLAPFRELARIAQGQGEPDRWRAIGRQFVLAIAIVIAVVLLYLGIDALVRQGLLDGTRGPVLLRQVPNFVFAVFALVGVLVVTSLVALWFGSTSGEESPEAIAAAHRAGVRDPGTLVIDLTAVPKAPAGPPAAPHGAAAAEAVA